MLIVISPAKNINFDAQIPEIQKSTLGFEAESKLLLNELKKYDAKQLSLLMTISPKLSQLNYERFQQMNLPFDPKQTKPALLVFSGDVYQGMEPTSFSVADLEYAQHKLVILSGFYGLLRPLDGILPYRLEMGTHLKIRNHPHLYSFWGNKLLKKIQSAIDEQGDNVLINLASNEYFKAANASKLKARIITPVFKEYKDGSYSMVSFYAKRARGLMSAYILKNRIQNPEEIKLFDLEGYQYNDLLTKGEQWVFTRA